MAPNDEPTDSTGCGGVKCDILADQIAEKRQLLGEKNAQIAAEAARWSALLQEIRDVAAEWNVAPVMTAEEVQAQLALVQTLLSDQQHKHDSKLVALQAAEAEVERLLKAIEKLEEQLTVLRVDYDRTVAALDQSYPTGADESAEAARVAQLEADLAAIEASMATAEAELARLMAELDQALAARDKAKAEADAEYRIWQVFDDWRVAYETMQAVIVELDDVRRRIDDLQTEQLEIEVELDPLEKQFDKCCLGPADG